MSNRLCSSLYQQALHDDVPKSIANIIDFCDIFFNLNKYFVLDSQGGQFIQEASEVKNWYLDELDKIEKYAQEEYTTNINLGIVVSEFEEPQYKINSIEIQTKRKLIGLIRKYFNKELFQFNKPYIREFDVFKEEAVETPHEMLVALNVNKNRIYSLI